MWFTPIDRVGAARASLYARLQPFLGAFFALAVLSEEMGPLQVLGGIVIGAGILLARQARPPAPSWVAYNRGRETGCGAAAPGQNLEAATLREARARSGWALPRLPTRSKYVGREVLIWRQEP